MNGDIEGESVVEDKDNDDDVCFGRNGGGISHNTSPDLLLGPSISPSINIIIRSD